jgi:hypothetical protein
VCGRRATNRGESENAGARQRESERADENQPPLTTSALSCTNTLEALEPSVSVLSLI